MQLWPGVSLKLSRPLGWVGTQLCSLVFDAPTLALFGTGASCTVPNVDRSALEVLFGDGFGGGEAVRTYSDLGIADGMSIARAWVCRHSK